jgi:uncharacterized protein (DUF2126 family)
VSIHVALNHVTHYRYDRAINLGPQVVRLRPAPHCRTRILSYSLKVTPAKHFINWQQDPQANYLARLVFPEKTTEFRVEVDLVAEMAVFNPFDFFLEPHAENFPFSYTDPTVAQELAPFRIKAQLTPLLGKYLAKIPLHSRRTIDFLVELTQLIYKDVGYLIRMEPGVQTPEETLAKASGSCRDSAWLMVQLLRHLGLAARFVSGYLIQLTPDVKSLDGPSGPEADFTDLHAWCEVYLPGAGWIGLDPTSGLFAGEGHLPLACSPEPSSAAPITGVLDECETEFSHHMRVDRVYEAPRVTKPYTREQWLAIEALGRRIDADLDAMDVRLTMGGEPTFVAVDDPDGAEWNTAALGPTKRLRAAELFERMRARYAPFGLVHFGQGKWYPGEQLPRWSLNCYWRKDGQPVWGNPALYANEKKHYGADAKVAAAFLQQVATRLGMSNEHIFPAYEDLMYYMWRERRLPDNVNPLDSRVEDPLERARLAKVFSEGLNQVIGHVLPISRNALGSAWQTGPWFLRTETCYLIPGDSPIGYRLPLDSQPWVKESDYPYVNQADPSVPVPPLPAHADIRRQVLGERPGKVTGTPSANLKIVRPAAGESAQSLTRTSMCAQPRDGRLYIFMPPLQTLDDYLELVAAIEATADALQMPVIMEGYEPPSDPRLVNFKVTPDPGVIEVNIHPSANWDDLVERTKFLYDSAHQCRLTSEKFMVDGRHTGTGGGNHFVMGSVTPTDSPFLRRPDLLRSLISYWHNHPSLSYLFSGLFIGPTSQAPRVDEARNDALYELEIAFKQMPRRGEQVAPWVIDRLLRNLLVDSTGNTHRSEFCIDKLYSPDSSSGRLGLLEMRAFEMPPHAEMSLAQQLLLRALVARFWEEPYAPERLTRWGTELHDRFMLPYFLQQDFADVITELNQFGYKVQKNWFDPHFEFRFPRVGDFASMGMELELRHALEPWHVLGEEGSGGGAVRYVDSSLERLQIKASGMAPDRYQLTCNGVPVPMRPTGNVGEFVGGVRYRAWQPPNCLQPTIGVHSPLIFDLVDTWMKRSMGGCQYHVMHPGGRSHDSFPVNAYEAESRRLARFFRMGHSPGLMRALATSVNAEHPFTLDLRRP